MLSFEFKNRRSERPKKSLLSPKGRFLGTFVLGGAFLPATTKVHLHLSCTKKRPVRSQRASAYRAAATADRARPIAEFQPTRHRPGHPPSPLLKPHPRPRQSVMLPQRLPFVLTPEQPALAQQRHHLVDEHLQHRR